MAQQVSSETADRELLSTLELNNIKKHLLTVGMDQGLVKYDDILAVLPKAELFLDFVDDLFETLIDKGIEIGQQDEEPAHVEKEDNDSLVLDQDGFNDSTTLYLREIVSCQPSHCQGRGHAGQTY